jgi:hypothetical protein
MKLSKDKVSFKIRLAAFQAKAALTLVIRLSASSIKA